jgi:hypothetical protein
VQPFPFGVLQALAQQKWLHRIDYLSTVSGGGYIGCWLSALICRTRLNLTEYTLRKYLSSRVLELNSLSDQEGKALSEWLTELVSLSEQNQIYRWALLIPPAELGEVMRKTLSKRLNLSSQEQKELQWLLDSTSKSEAEICKMNKSKRDELILEASIARVEQRLAPNRIRQRETEPGEIAFLRAYSNYLTPRLGLSGDTLAFLAGYIRNFFLNLLLGLTYIICFIGLVHFAGVSLSDLILLLDSNVSTSLAFIHNINAMILVGSGSLLCAVVSTCYIVTISSERPRLRLRLRHIFHYILSGYTLFQYCSLA